MRTRRSAPENVIDPHTARDERIGDQGAMTAPRHRLGTQDRDGSTGRGLDEIEDLALERGGLHVIRETAKAFVLPAGVDRVRARPPQSAETRLVLIADARAFELGRQRFASEMRK